MHSQITSPRHSCPISEIRTFSHNLHRKDVVEQSNCSLLIRRVLKPNCSVTADCEFITSIQKSYVSESVEQYEAIIENPFCCQHFCTKSSLSFSCVVLPFSLFRATEVRNSSRSREIANFLNQAIGSLRIALPKCRFIWDWGMSTAMLCRDELKVKYLASYAVVILRFNPRGITIDRLLSEV
jgi:hypothetical protein